MSNRYDDIVKYVLVSEDEITEIAKQLGEKISADYAGKKLVLVGMLKGAMPFMMELAKRITLPVEMDFIQTSSYHGGTSSSTAVMFKKDIEINVVDKHVLLIDDVVDTAKKFESYLIGNVELPEVFDDNGHLKELFEIAQREMDKINKRDTPDYAEMLRAIQTGNAGISAEMPCKSEAE